MKDLLILAIDLLATIARLVRPGGVRAVVAESFHEGIDMDWDLIPTPVVVSCELSERTGS